MELHFTIPNLLISITIVQGLTFALLLAFVKQAQRYANRFLAIVLLIVALHLCWVVIIDTKLLAYYPGLLVFPFSWILAMGPALFGYTESITNPNFRIQWRHWPHAIPIVLEQVVHFFAVREGIFADVPFFETWAFQTFSPIIQLGGILSITLYSLMAIRKLNTHQRLAQQHFSNALQYNLSWLKRFLIGFALLWLFWVPYTLVDYFVYNWELSIAAYYPIYLFLAGFMLWIAFEAYRSPQIMEVPSNLAPILDAKAPKPSPSNEYQEQAQAIAEEMEVEQYYLQPDLNLTSLAQQMDYSPALLSKVINTGLGKNFSDFVNAYRVEAMKRTLHDSKFDHYTNEAIAYECGFNSRATANRTFKKLAGVSPSQYRKGKEVVSD